METNSTQKNWTLRCSSCDTPAAIQRASTCEACGQPLFAFYGNVDRSRTFLDRWDAWRYAPLLPIAPGETPVSLGEGLTPLMRSESLADYVGVRTLWIKDEGRNPTGSFKARGMSAAVTRAKGEGVEGIVVPTAGNAGAALAAYGAAAGLEVRVFAPATTPRPILETIESYGAHLERVDGHIGDAGRMANAFAAEHGYMNIATLREPYRVEGMKTMGFELAEQLGWRYPDVVVYPTGGGEGTIGIWKAFDELQRGGWLPADARQPRYVVAQAAGCAPIARAFADGTERAVPWESPWTHAAGLRVPAPFGDRLLLRILRETEGLALTAGEEDIREHTRLLASHTGIDAAPEGGCALSVLRQAVMQGTLSSTSNVVMFNTGAGASYRA